MSLSRLTLPGSALLARPFKGFALLVPLLSALLVPLLFALLVPLRESPQGLQPRPFKVFERLIG